MESQIFLHSLVSNQEFTYNDKTYRTITPLRHNIVNRALQHMKREVMDMETNKTIKLPYFTEVSPLIPTK